MNNEFAGAAEALARAAEQASGMGWTVFHLGRYDIEAVSWEATARDCADHEEHEHGSGATAVQALDDLTTALQRRAER